MVLCAGAHYNDRPTIKNAYTLLMFAACKLSAGEMYVSRTFLRSQWCLLLFSNSHTAPGSSHFTVLAGNSGSFFLYIRFSLTDLKFTAKMIFITIEFFTFRLHGVNAAILRSMAEIPQRSRNTCSSL